MTKSGERIDPGWKNNGCFYGYYLGICDQQYTGCKGQAQNVKNALECERDDCKLELDDNWKFEEKFRLIPTHYWLEGTSSNPNDPTLIIDPWRNKFEQKQNKNH